MSWKKGYDKARKDCEKEIEKMIEEMKKSKTYWQGECYGEMALNDVLAKIKKLKEGK